MKEQAMDIIAESAIQYHSVISRQDHAHANITIRYEVGQSPITISVQGAKADKVEVVYFLISELLKAYKDKIDDSLIPF